MHPPQVKKQALDLVAAGYNDCEVSRRLGIPRRTILDWRRPTYVSQRECPIETCPRCWRATRQVRFVPDDYAELLALYLGDGSISIHARTQRLRITLDMKYPGIIEATRSLLARCFPYNDAHVGARGPEDKCVDVSVYCSHLSCLFPQHGPGMKYRRGVKLEGWQADHVAKAPWAFLRGCIWSDGCVFVNRTGPYEYLSYQFSNKAEGISRLFVSACDRVGVFTRTTFDPGRAMWSTRINRRASVALMLDHIGVKE